MTDDLKHVNMDEGDEHLPLPSNVKPDTYYASRPWQGGFNHSWVVNSRNEFPDLVKHIQSLTFTKAFVPTFIVLHNTGAPTLVGWMNTPGGQLQRQKNLEHYYKNENHWSAGPHFFVSKDMILEGTPLNRMGTHSPSFNDEAIGVEMAGDYDKEGFDVSVKSNVTYLIAILHRLLKLGDPTHYVYGVKGLHFHKEDQNTTHKNCPGKNVDKAALNKIIIDKMWKYRDLKMPQRVMIGDVHLSYDRMASGPSGLEAQLNMIPLGENQAYPRLEPQLKGRVIRIGSYGSVVLLAQKLLKVMGYSMNSTGYYGLASQAAVKDFQKKKGLKVDGEIGPVTASMMDATLLPPAPLPVDPNKPPPDPIKPPPPAEGGWNQAEIPFP